MNRRNPLAKWTLPDVINPPDSICYKIPVPDNIYHRAAFWGAMLSLASAYKWQDDPAHTAKEVAAVWRNIVDNLITIECGDVVALHGGILQEDFMPIRVDCDCRIWVTCCDGTEVELATVGMINQPTQPGDGGPTPPTPGSCQAYAGKIQGNGYWLAPLVVNTGDTIEITSANGATYDPANGYWCCPDGNQFFAGACVPYTFTDAGNPMPAIPSGKLIAYIAGTYYDVYNGIFTVPSGIVAQSVQFQFNYDNLASSSGEVSFNVNICNNESANFTHVFDFKLSNGGWFNFPYISGGSQDWYPGIGWKSLPCQNVVGGSAEYTLISIINTLPSARTITGISMEYTAVLGANVGGDHTRFNILVGFADNFVIDHTPQTANNANDIWTGSITGCTEIRVHPLLAMGDATCDMTPEVTLTKITVSGLGTDPF